MALLLLGTGYGHLYENPAALLLHIVSPGQLISLLVTLGVPPEAVVPPAERNNPFYNGVYNVFTDDIGFAGAHAFPQLALACLSDQVNLQTAHVFAPQSSCAASPGCCPRACCASV